MRQTLVGCMFTTMRKSSCLAELLGRVGMDPALGDRGSGGNLRGHNSNKQMNNYFQVKLFNGSCQKALTVRLLVTDLITQEMDLGKHKELQIISGDNSVFMETF